MANALHDGVAQEIAYLAMRLPLLRESIERSEAARALFYLDDLEDAVGHLQSGVRDLIERGRPEGTGADLQARLAALCRRWSQRAELPVSLAWETQKLHMQQESVDEIMFIVGEALSNVHRHAQAKQAVVQVLQRDGALELTVRDNGRGLNGMPQQASSESHFGILIMRERAEAISGNLEISSVADGGTQVRLLVPLA